MKEIIEYIEKHPQTDAIDVAIGCNLPIPKTYQIINELIKEEIITRSYIGVSTQLQIKPSYLLRRKLRANSDEFLILAQLTLLNLSDAGRIQKAKTYFEHSLKSDRNPLNTTAYESFLKDYGLKKSYHAPKLTRYGSKPKGFNL